MHQSMTKKSYFSYDFMINKLAHRGNEIERAILINGTVLGSEKRRFVHDLKGTQGKQGKEFRSNRNIRANTVRLINQEGKNLGIMALESALQVGSKANCLVVEVGTSSAGSETVCRLISEQQLYAKMKNEKKKHQKTTKTKEIKLTGKISDHDLDIKVNKIREFLEGHHTVKVFVAHRKRQNTSFDDKRAVINTIAEQVSGLGCLQGDPKPVGNGLRCIFIPHHHKTK